jgi:hypothetical protein
VVVGLVVVGVVVVGVVVVGVVVVGVVVDIRVVVVDGVTVITGHSHLSPPIGNTKPSGHKNKISPPGVHFQNVVMFSGLAYSFPHESGSDTLQ